MAEVNWLASSEVTRRFYVEGKVDEGAYAYVTFCDGQVERIELHYGLGEVVKIDGPYPIRLLKSLFKFLESFKP